MRRASELRGKRESTRIRWHCWWRLWQQQAGPVDLIAMLKDVEKQAKDRLHSQCSQKPSALRNKTGRDENVRTENPPIASRLSISSTCCFLYSMFKCPQQLLLVASCASPTPKEMDLPRLSLPENGIYFLTHLPLYFLMALFLCPSLQQLVSAHVPVHTSLMRFQVFTLSAATHHG